MHIVGSTICAYCRKFHMCILLEVPYVHIVGSSICAYCRPVGWCQLEPFFRRVAYAHSMKERDWPSMDDTSVVRVVWSDTPSCL